MFSSRLLNTVICFCALFTTTSVARSSDAATGGESSAVQTTKVRTTDKAVAARLLESGGKLVADYEGFVVIDAPEAAASAELNAEILTLENSVLLNAGAIDTRTPAALQLQTAQNAGEGNHLHLVQFAGPIRPEWYNELTATGVSVVTYIPSNAYLVYGDAKAILAVQGMASRQPMVQWQAPYLDGYKLDPMVIGAVDENNLPIDQFSIQMVADKLANAKSMELIEQLKLEPVKLAYNILNYYNVIVRISPERIIELAGRPDVISIQPYDTPTLFDERQDQIVAGNLSGNNPSGVGYLAWLTSKGFTQAQFTASGFAVDVTDSGLDNGTTSPNHLGLYVNGVRPGTSRVAYNRLVGTPNSGSTIKGCDGHGTLNSHIVCGYNDLTTSPHRDASGYHYGLGVAPFVRVGSSVIFDPNSYTSPNLTTLQSMAYNDNARISSNSWGSVFSSAYTTDSQTFDALVRDAQPTGSAFPNAGNQEMVIVIANGNAGSGAGTVRSPATAKNVISVGAAEGVQTFGGSDGCGTPDSEANSANDIATFSSRGPCPDGRKKPDIVAPGTHISGGVIQTASPAATGTADACYTGNGVCGGVSSDFFPSSGQQYYTASSGTSHSTPAVAGGCALVRQFFINQGMSVPSPAMTKAMLMNSARYMTGTAANDTLWSNAQGMGEMHLGEVFDRGAVTPTVFRDQNAIDTFTASGQSRTFTGTVSTAAKPFRVTLAWSDAPGATSGSAFKNNIDLTVSVNGNTYKGNVFSGANSTTGGSADAANNVESVFLPAGIAGAYTVTITATNINSDGVPNSGGSLDQDFALVIYNATTASVPVIAPISSTITSDSCAGGNGAIDPGELVTLDITLQNVGTGNAANVVGTLLATGGVTSPSGPQTYGAMTAGGGTVTKSFSFTATGACGSTLVASLQLQDGASSLGTLTFNFTMGTPAVSISENFDGVTAPALPAGWVAAVESGSTTAWVTNSSVRDTVPNSVFASDPSSATGNRLTSPSIAISTPSAVLTFKNNYNTESTWDGGVLEISINGGAFTDILTAGGTFTSGGYNGTLNSSTNPLSGRSAWTGNSSGFITTSVNLPASAAGQNIQLRFRMGSDGSQSGTGWRIDTLSISEPSCCTDPCAGGAPATPTNELASPSTVCAGGSTSLSASVGAGQTVDWYTGSCGGTLAGTGTSLNVSPAGDTTYFAQARNTTTGCVSASCASVSVTVSAAPAAPTGAAASPSSICQGSNASLSATVGGGVTIDWFTGSCGGTPVAGGANPTVAPTTTTTYFARARNTTTGCVSATCASVTLTVVTPPATPTSPSAAPPTICPGGSSTLSASVSAGETVDWFTGSCGGTPVAGGANPSVSPASTTTYFARARKTASGCVSAACATVTVTVGDTTNPQITTCSPNQSASANASCQAAVPDFTSGIVATDNCTAPGSLVITQSPTAGTLVGLGVTPITVTVKDTANNQATCNPTFTVNDTTNPSFTGCPANIGPVATGPGQSTAMVSWTPPAALDNCSTPSVVASHNPGDAFPVGMTSVTYTATDGASNMAVCSFTVTVQDAESPSIQNCPTTLMIDSAAGQCAGVASWTEPTVIDNLPGATISQIQGPASGSLFAVGTTVVQYRADDTSGNMAFCQFDVIISDVEDPAFTNCPSDVTVGVGSGSCDAIATWTAPTATDNCGVSGVASNHLPGETFPLGTTPVLYTATDVNGRQATCGFNVIVEDHSAPVITTCATSQTIAPDENCQAAVPDFTGGVAANDECTDSGSLVITQSPLAGTLVSGGPTTITITVADAAGNQATCEATLTVTDDTPPEIGACPGNIVVNTNAPNCAAVVTWDAPTASDNCAGVSLSQTSSPVSGLVSGSTFDNGSVTTITYTATDATALTSECSFTVSVVYSPDVNNNGSFGLDDIDAFVDVLLDLNVATPDIYRADVNCDGVVDGRDIEPFTALLVGP